MSSTDISNILKQLDELAQPKQLPALFKPQNISPVLGSPEKKNPMSGYFVGGEGAEPDAKPVWYAIRHRDTGHTLGSHQDEATARDEMAGLGDRRQEYKLVKTSRRPNQFGLDEAYDARDEGDVWYRFDPKTQGLRQRTFSHADEQQARGEGWKESHAAAMREQGFFPSKYKKGQYVKKGQDGKWITINPYGTQSVEESDDGQQYAVTIDAIDHGVLSPITVTASNPAEAKQKAIASATASMAKRGYELQVRSAAVKTAQGIAEGTKESLAQWEERMKKLGYKITKNNKTATYHAWEGTTHKGSYNAHPVREGVAEGMNDWALKDKPKVKSIPQTSGMNSYAMKGDVHNKAYDFPPTYYDKDGKNMYGQKKPELKSQTEGASEAKVIGHVGDVAGHGKVVQCDKCDTDLRDDHGFALDNGKFICRSGKCSMRQAKNRLAAMAARGEKPRWRKDEDVAEGSSSPDEYKRRLASIQSLRYDNPQEYAKQYRALLQAMPEEHAAHANQVQKGSYSPGQRGSGTGRIGGVAEGSLNEERDARIKRIQELSEGLEMADLAKVPMFVVNSLRKAAFATGKEAVETKDAIKTAFNWNKSTPEQQQAAKKQLYDIAKIAAGLVIAGAAGTAGATALGVAHASTAIGAVAHTVIEHLIADIGIEAVATVLSSATGINVVKNVLHNITTSSGHEFEKKLEKQQHQQDVKQRMAAAPLAGPSGVLPGSKVEEGWKQKLGVAEEASPMIKPPSNRFDSKQEAFAHAKAHGGKVFKSTYTDPNTGNKNVSFVVKKDQDVEEGWKQKLGAAALAGSMAMGANARVVPGQDEPGVNRLTGKPNIAQVAAADSVPDSAETEKPSFKGFSTSYLQKAADPNRFGRFLISVENAKAELAAREAAYQKRAQGVDEVAPPGARAERMVKHIKQGYARDGKLTGKEKAIAYATTWKAHNQGQVEEASADLVGFHLDTERAYNAVMERFGDVVEQDQESGMMTVPRRYWLQLEQVAHDADGIGAIEAGGENIAVDEVEESYWQPQIDEAIAQEDVLDKEKRHLGDYLQSVADAVKHDAALSSKDTPVHSSDTIGSAVKTVTTDDGHDLKIHGNEDDGFRISIKGRPSRVKFKSLDEAGMACEMYRSHRRHKLESADYIEEQ